MNKQALMVLMVLMVLLPSTLGEPVLKAFKTNMNISIIGYSDSSNNTFTNITITTEDNTYSFSIANNTNSTNIFSSKDILIARMIEQTNLTTLEENLTKSCLEYFNQCEGKPCKEQWQDCKIAKANVVGKNDELTNRTEDYELIQTQYSSCSTSLSTAQGFQSQYSTCTTELDNTKKKGENDKWVWAFGGAGIFWAGIYVFKKKIVDRNDPPKSQFEKETGKTFTQPINYYSGGKEQ